jgi:hypothetical protein
MKTAWLIAGLTVGLLACSGVASAVECDEEGLPSSPALLTALRAAGASAEQMHQLCDTPGFLPLACSQPESSPHSRFASEAELRERITGQWLLCSTASLGGARTPCSSKTKWASSSPPMGGGSGSSAIRLVRSYAVEVLTMRGRSRLLTPWRTALGPTR